MSSVKPFIKFTIKVPNKPNIMKTRKFPLTLAALMFASAALVSSCKKKTEATDTDTTAASDNSMSESTSNDVVSMASEASENGTMSSYKMGENDNVSALSCATVTTNTVTHIITATFSGTSPCLDGKTRSGTLTFDYSASTLGATHYRNPGYVVTVTSQNYVVDGNQITVNKTVTNTTPVGFNPMTTNMTWSISSNISIVKANGNGTVTWHCNRTKTLLNTSDTVNVYHGQAIPISWNKAKVGITGNANGQTVKGESYTATITSQLVRDMTCSPDVNHPGHHPFIQGTIDFTPGSKATRHIDYGSGSCDLNYTVTINGVTYQLTLP